MDGRRKISTEFILDKTTQQMLNLDLDLVTLTSMTTSSTWLMDKVIAFPKLLSQQLTAASLVAAGLGSSSSSSSWSNSETALEETYPSLGVAYKMIDVARHCYPESCWIVIDDVVYDVTEFISQHPGGSEIILEHAGSDATGAFQDVQHSGDAKTIMDKYRIGQLVR